MPRSGLIPHYGIPVAPASGVHYHHHPLRHLEGGGDRGFGGEGGDGGDGGAVQYIKGVLPLGP